MLGTVCNNTLNYAHLNGIYQGWGVIETCFVSNKFYKSPLTNYVFGVAMGGLLLKLQNFKKVKLIFGHPV